MRTKIRKKTPVGTPIVSGSSGPIEHISSFVDSNYCHKIRVLYKNTMDFLNFIENTQIPDDVVLTTLDVSLSTPTVIKKKELILFATITKITMSRNYLSLQVIYGN